MRNYKHIVMLMLFVVTLKSQQLPQYSQYMLNELAINPAVAGKDDFSEVRMSSRLQWTGITDAPRTYMLNVHGPIEKKNMGLGMSMFTDIVGPTRRTGLNFTYAYKIKLKEDVHLSMGISAGMLQYGIDGNKIRMREEGDEQLQMKYQTIYLPDFGMGVYLYSKKKYYIGISLPQINQSQIPLYPTAYKNSRLATQLNINGAYTYSINADFSVEPSFLVKYERPAPMKIDLGVRAIYKDQIWAGLLYRHHDAVSCLIGFKYQDYLLIGYSYDFTTVKTLSAVAGSTHEFMLGIRFSRKQAATWEKQAE